MITLQLKEQDARQLYADSSAEWKRFLEASSPDGFFSTDPSDRLLTLSDVFRENGTDEADFYKKCEGLADHEIAGREARQIALAFNGGKKINPFDVKQKKWFPWHIVDEAGGFRFLVSFYALDYSTVGSGFCFFESKHSSCAGERFIDVYKRLKTS